MAETLIVSFVVRFIQEQTADGGAPWRGVIRHVQSRAEMHFGTVEEAMQFMSGYVSLDRTGVAEETPEKAPNANGSTAP